MHQIFTFFLIFIPYLIQAQTRFIGEFEDYYYFYRKDYPERELKGPVKSVIHQQYKMRLVASDTTFYETVGEVITHYSDSGKLRLQRKEEIHYNKAGNTTFIRDEFHTKQDVLKNRVIFRYRNGRLLESKASAANLVIRHTYNNKNQLLERVMQTKTGDFYADQGDQTYSYSYDTLGRITVIEKRERGYSMRNFYTYNESGQLDSIVEGYDGSGKRWTTFLYDSLGRLTNEKMKGTFDDFVYARAITYNNDTVSVIVTNQYENQEEPLLRFTYIYHKGIRVSFEQYLASNPNIVRSYSCIVDEHGNWTEKTWRDGDFNYVEKREIKYY